MASIHAEPFIRKNSFRNEQFGNLTAGFQFNMILTDTRGEFLSCLEDFKVLVDNVPVSASDVFISLSGRKYCTKELSSLSDIFWSLDEDALISVYNGTGVEDLSRVEVSFGLRISFVGDWEHRLVVPKYDSIDFGGAK